MNVWRLIAWCLSVFAGIWLFTVKSIQLWQHNRDHRPLTILVAVPLGLMLLWIVPWAFRKYSPFNERPRATQITPDHKNKLDDNEVKYRPLANAHYDVEHNDIHFIMDEENLIKYADQQARRTSGKIE